VKNIISKINRTFDFGESNGYFFITYELRKVFAHSDKNKGFRAKHIIDLMTD
jgi:hypothetical protein